MIYYNMKCFLNMIIISVNKNFSLCQGVQIWWIRKCQNSTFAKFFPIALQFFWIGGGIYIDGRIYILHTICVQYSLNTWNVTKGGNRLWLNSTIFDLIGKGLDIADCYWNVTISKITCHHIFSYLYIQHQIL